MEPRQEMKAVVECRGGACSALGTSHARAEQAPPLQGKSDRGPAILLWLAVTLGFLLLIGAWYVLFKVAHSAQVKTVPLATQGGRP